jgi:hypothetical protein
MSDSISVAVSYVPAPKAGEKVPSCVLLAFHEEIGDSGLTNTTWAWSGNKVDRKVGDVITLPADLQPDFYEKSSVDEETGEVTSFTWVRWVRK